MEFGKWELRDNGYTSYYFSKDSKVYPSSNAVDEGKLHTEENVRNIYRDIVGRNFVTKYNYFSMKLNPNRNGIILTPGEAVIQGYHFYANNTIEIKVPDNTVTNELGQLSPVQPITQYTLGISLSYDAANHVTGDIVNKEAAVGESEVLSGVYVAWFDECQLECYYDNILILGRAWVQKGAIIPDGTNLDSERIIYHGFEPDPFKDHKFDANSVEVQIHGHKTTKYDTLRDNMTQIHEPLYSYDSMHFPIELDRQDRTKPPSFVTDVQDFINHVPDWYTSKYGDYMTGALRFNNLSIDAKREFKNLGIIKDSTENEYSDSVFISPRTYGNLIRDITKTVELGDFDYSVGGTIMSIVPDSYRDSTDWNDGYTGIHSALVSQLNGETGLRIHYGMGSDETDLYNTTRIVHYNLNDDGQRYNKGNSKNTSKFIIENTDEDGRKAAINIKNGEIFIDSITSPDANYSETMNNDGFNGDYYGSGIQLFVSGSKTNSINNVDVRVDETKLSIAKHIYSNHRTGTRGTTHIGSINDDLYLDLGVGISYDMNYTINTDPYFTLGNLNIRSNNNSSLSKTVKQNTIEVFNTNNDELPFVRIKPRTYSEQYVAEELVQIGTSKYDDLSKNHAQDSTLNRIVMKRVGTNDKDNTSQAFTYFEQDFRVSSGESRVFNKMIPAIDNKDIIGKNGTYLSPEYHEIAGIYSAGNIGASSKWLSTGRSGERMGDHNDPYTDDVEWVRFTRFRYDLDKDQINGGTNTNNHDSANGRKWGDTYNIEFNTNVANRRANQIIWKYNGSKGKQSDTIDNTPPVILSYVHDNTTINQGTPTKYTNVSGTPGYQNGKGTYETWIDHAGVTQYNPTYKVRDFLMLENAGLVVQGDINNPSLSGDNLNTSNHLGVTIVAGRVYNAVYNDFAETFEKLNMNDVAKPGDLIALDPETGKYVIAEGYENKLVVGVQSNTYAFLAGGNRVDNTQDIIDLENEYFTVALCGKVWVNVTKDSYIVPGDMLVSSFEKGKATKSTFDTPGTVIGKALTKPKYFEEHDEYKVLMLVITR